MHVCIPSSEGFYAAFAVFCMSVSNGHQGDFVWGDFIQQF